MKTKNLFLACLFLISATVWAAPVIMVGSLTTVSNTTATSTAIVGATNRLALSPFSITHSQLSNNVGALSVSMQISLDNSNFYTIGTYTPSSTNSGTDAFSIAPTNLPVYLRASVTTTNRVDVGGTYGN